MGNDISNLPGAVAIEEPAASLGVEVFVGGENIGGSDVIPIAFDCLGESGPREMSIRIAKSALMAY